MLTSIHVRNLAIAEDIHVSFGDGLNVITGETGAGKSILAGALALVLGERADKGIIRSGADACMVEACFEVSELPELLVDLLEELSLPPCEDGVLIVRRTVSATSAGRNTVNDSTVTLQSLRRIGNLLVDQHGPHDHQALLAETEQLRLLDSYGNTTREQGAYQKAHHRVAAILKERDALAGSTGELEQELDLLRYQVEEIQSAELGGEDEEALVTEHAFVANTGRIAELAGTINESLSGDEASAFDALVSARHAAAQLSEFFPEASEWESQLGSVLVQVQDLAAAAIHTADTADCSPERLQWLEDRMSLIHRLKRKYGGSLKAVLDRLSSAQQRLDELANRDERLAAIDAKLATEETCRREAADALSRKRTQAARRLGKAITAELHGLGFGNSAFEVNVERTPTPIASGTDVVDFQFAPNVGEPMRSLKAIASSGEISRVMLAIKAVLAGHDNIPVLVFDEVDANVGGEVGNAVGARMARVAISHQVICITHLPQVAVHGQTHLVAAKQVVKGRTSSSIIAVEADRRVAEIARMLGGSDLTSVATRHAREMLETAQR